MSRRPPDPRAGVPGPTVADALLVNAAARLCLGGASREMAEECLRLIRDAGGPGGRYGPLERLAFATRDLAALPLWGPGWGAAERRVAVALEPVLRDRCAVAPERLMAEREAG